ncbi:MAG: hypothetical protein QXQ94_06810 [Candidatus Bathyarchaeia archaeon]
MAFAQWEAISSGYAVTTDYHGMIVPPGALVTATAGTTNPNITSVTFLWKDPNETVKYEINVAVWSNGSTYNGKLIYYANSSYMPDIVGDWGVQALFIGEGGTVKANHADVVRIRATSFNVVPDLPVIGTAGAATTMLLGLGLFMYLKKRRP